MTKMTKMIKLIIDHLARWWHRRLGRQAAGKWVPRNGSNVRTMRTGFPPREEQCEQSQENSLGLTFAGRGVRVRTASPARTWSADLRGHGLSDTKNPPGRRVWCVVCVVSHPD